MAGKDKGDQKRKTFGGFLGGAVTHLMRDPQGAEPSEDLNTDGLQKAAERYSLPRRVKRLEKELKELKRRKSSRGRCDLWGYVAFAKKAIPSKVSDHGALAAWVDDYLAMKGKKFQDACPKGWLTVSGFPSSLSAARTHKQLKGRVKTLISQAE
jgi:hypothetical protein